jgi:hypothetical protein
MHDAALLRLAIGAGPVEARDHSQLGEKGGSVA